jgi:phage terminase large subunit-like protein
VWRRKSKVSEGLWFDERAAQGAVRFFERLLVHVKGEWAGRSFKLQGWQREEIIRPLFGWKRQDGTRRYRTAYIEIPRKNGKSSLAAGIALYLFFADDEYGAEVYSAAADRDQAGIVFGLASDMVATSPELAKRCQVYKRAIVNPGTMSTYRVLSADAPTKHGLNAHGVVIDELHAQPNRELVDVLVTSTGARRQPMVVAITTAGFDRESVCWEYHEYARQVLSGIIEDESFFAYIRAAEEDDDWTDPAVWQKANPGLGVTVKLDYLETEARRAEQVPAYQNTFRRLHLNQWTQQESRWMDMTAWDACGEPIDAKLLEGQVCYGGLDLASSSDLASLGLIFPAESGEEERFAWLPFFLDPEGQPGGAITAGPGAVRDVGAAGADHGDGGECDRLCGYREADRSVGGAVQYSGDCVRPVGGVPGEPAVGGVGFYDGWIWAGVRQYERADEGIIAAGHGPQAGARRAGGAALDGG